MSAEIQPKKYGLLQIEPYYLNVSQILQKKSAEGPMSGQQDKHYLAHFQQQSTE